jgi:photosystem I subunit X
LFISTVLAALPETLVWSPKVGFVMILCNVLAIAIARNTVQKPDVGPQFPSPALAGGLSIPAFIGAASFGHILGVGAILGLANLGVL